MPPLTVRPSTNTTTNLTRRNNNNKPSIEPMVKLPKADSEKAMLRRQIEKANARVKELEETAKRQQELLKRVAESMPSS